MVNINALDEALNATNYQWLIALKIKETLLKAAMQRIPKEQRLTESEIQSRLLSQSALERERIHEDVSQLLRMLEQQLTNNEAQLLIKTFSNDDMRAYQRIEAKALVHSLDQAIEDIENGNCQL